MEAYDHNPWGSVKTAARVTLNQLLTALVSKLHDFKDPVSFRKKSTRIIITNVHVHYSYWPRNHLYSLLVCG